MCRKCQDHFAQKAALGVPLFMLALSIALRVKGMVAEGAGDLAHIWGIAQGGYLQLAYGKTPPSGVQWVIDQIEAIEAEGVDPQDSIAEFAKRYPQGPPPEVDTPDAWRAPQAEVKPNESKQEALLRLLKSIGQNTADTEMDELEH